MSVKNNQTNQDMDRIQTLKCERQIRFPALYQNRSKLSIRKQGIHIVTANNFFQILTIAATLLISLVRAFPGQDTDGSVSFENTQPGPHTLHSTTSPDGRFRAETSYKKIQILSVENDELIQTLSTSGSTNSPLFTADGTGLIAAVCRGNLGCISTLYLWDLETGNRTRLGECSGMVMDICTDTEGRKIAVSTFYGPIFSLTLTRKENKWIGGEIVIFDRDSTDLPVRIFCELQKAPDLEKLRIAANKELNDKKSQDAYVDDFNTKLAEACRESLPVRLGITTDGDKVAALFSNGVLSIFNTQTGRPEIIVGTQSRIPPRIPTEAK